jgi:hypothetical protein
MRRPAQLQFRRVYHFSPPYSLPPRFLDGVLRAEGKLLHLGFGRRVRLESCEGGPVRTLPISVHQAVGAHPQKKT